jgi:hypothetical protein
LGRVIEGERDGGARLGGGQNGYGSGTGVRLPGGGADAGGRDIEISVSRGGLATGGGGHDFGLGGEAVPLKIAELGEGVAGEALERGAVAGEAVEVDKTGRVGERGFALGGLGGVELEGAVNDGFDEGVFDGTDGFKFGPVELGESLVEGVAAGSGGRRVLRSDNGHSDLICRGRTKRKKANMG